MYKQWIPGDFLFLMSGLGMTRLGYGVSYVVPSLPRMENITCKDVGMVSNNVGMIDRAEGVLKNNEAL